MSPHILSSRVDPTSYTQAVSQIIDWAKQGDSHSVFAANVHLVMEAYDSHEFRDIVNSADLVTPDGMPLVWALHFKGYSHQERVYGPTLMLHLLDVATKEGISVGFLGSTNEIISQLAQKMKTNFPGLIIGAQIAPPFHPLSTAEDQRTIEEINDSGVKLLFVGLGCPKQEYWIANHSGSVQAVMIGVGAAFAFHAGVVRQAPPWIQKNGFEWLFRLRQEPRRLWKRYLLTNPRFLFLIFREILIEKNGDNRGHVC